jgi:hypothetical protein
MAIQYSSVNTLSREAAEKVRAQLTQAIVAARKTIHDSQDEVLYCLNFDFFELNKNA